MALSPRALGERVKGYFNLGEKSSKAPQARPSRRSDDASDGTLSGGIRRAYDALKHHYTGPLADAHLIVTLCVILSVIGLIMVLDASGPASLRDYGNYYMVFIRQVVFVTLGWIAFYVAVRLPVSALRKLAFPFYLVSIVLLVLVLIPGIGSEINGARSWFVFPHFSFQPSELAKISLIVILAMVLGQLNPMSTIGDMLKPMAGFFIPMVVLVVLQRDLGMAVTYGVVFFAFLFFGRMPMKVIGWLAFLAGTLFAILTVTVGFRADRLVTYWHQLQGKAYDAQNVGYQARQSLLALADGGITGVGLGQSRAKYFYLPEASNDFIFAILGEELGLLGALVVIGLYGALGFVGLRIASRVIDPALRLMAAVGTTSIVVQAFINMGYVSGLLPVTGLQLPLISAGGSATVTTLFLLGLITNAARHEREAIAAINTGGGRLGKFFRLPEPVVTHFDDTPDFGVMTSFFARLVNNPTSSSYHWGPKRNGGENGTRSHSPQRGQGASTRTAQRPPQRRSTERTLPPLDKPTGQRFRTPPRGSSRGRPNRPNR
ncbi:MAG: putative lipid II flippase FtsW [Lawsonella sp.]